MLSKKELVEEVESLPIEERVAVVDGLLRTLNSPDPEIDKEWIAVAKRRLSELRSGKVSAIPGEEVFARIKERFA